MRGQVGRQGVRTAGCASAASTGCEGGRGSQQAREQQASGPRDYPAQATGCGRGRGGGEGPAGTRPQTLSPRPPKPRGSACTHADDERDGEEPRSRRQCRPCEGLGCGARGRKAQRCVWASGVRGLERVRARGVPFFGSEGSWPGGSQQGRQAAREACGKGGMQQGRHAAREAGGRAPRPLARRQLEGHGDVPAGGRRGASSPQKAHSERRWCAGWPRRGRNSAMRSFASSDTGRFRPIVERKPPKRDPWS